MDSSNPMGTPDPSRGISTNAHIAEIQNVQNDSRVRVALSRKASESPAKVVASAEATCPKRAKLENGSARGLGAQSPPQSPVRRLALRAGGAIARAAGAHDRPSSNWIMKPPLIRRPNQQSNIFGFIGGADTPVATESQDIMVDTWRSSATSSWVAPTNASSLNDDHLDNESQGDGTVVINLQSAATRQSNAPTNAAMVTAASSHANLSTVAPESASRASAATSNAAPSNAAPANAAQADAAQADAAQADAAQADAVQANMAQANASQSIAAQANAAQAKKKTKKRTTPFEVPSTGFITWMREERIKALRKKNFTEGQRKKQIQSINRDLRSNFQFGRAWQQSLSSEDNINQAPATRSTIVEDDYWVVDLPAVTCQVTDT